MDGHQVIIQVTLEQPEGLSLPFGPAKDLVADALNAAHDGVCQILIIRHSVLPGVQFLGLVLFFFHFKN